MGMPRYTPLSEIVSTCEQLYAAHGFVKWSDVAQVHGISRQGVLNRLRTATERGDISPDAMDRWRSTSARVAQSKNDQALREENARLRLSMTLTPANKRWLETECVARRCRAADIINGLITKAREEA